MGFALKPGLYEVIMWNGYHAILVRYDIDEITGGPIASYVDLDKEDLPTHIGGVLTEGEHLNVKLVTEIEAIDRPKMPRRQRLLIELENERRKQYGAKSL